MCGTGSVSALSLSGVEKELATAIAENNRLVACCRDEQGDRRP